MGGRKLYELLQPFLLEHQIKMGRDRLFNVLSAITNVTGDALDRIESAARSTAKTFGTDASANVESYKLILSQLDPAIAKNAEAIKMMGNNVNVLSKSMGGDTVAATNVLTTAMNQFGVSTENPITAAKVMADMMNVMAAGAQAGSAELPQIQSALEQVGMVAKTTGLSFVETNVQIQLLDKSGKKGTESGVALRNVLTTLSEGRFASKDATEGLKQYGISTFQFEKVYISILRLYFKGGLEKAAFEDIAESPPLIFLGGAGGRGKIRGTP